MPTVEVVHPTSGSTVQPSLNTDTFIIDPSGVLTLLTVKLPYTNHAFDQIINICSTKTIVTLSLQSDDGEAIVGAIGSLALGGFAEYTYSSEIDTWVRTG